MRLLWIELPFVYMALQGALLSHTSVANITPPRPELFWTAIFPLGTVLAVYALRWRRAPVNERCFAAAVLGTALGILALSYFTRPRFELTNQQIRHIWEVMGIFQAVILPWHAWTQRRALALLFLGPVAVYGFVLENGGIWLGYFQELGHRWYLGPFPAPLFTMMGWISMFYLATHTAWAAERCVPGMTRYPVLMALVATLAALSIDLQMDPVATAAGVWTWHDALPAGPMGVPMVNFVAWFSAVLPFSWVLFQRAKNHNVTGYDIADMPHCRWMWTQIPFVLAVAVVLFFTIMAVFEGGLDGPTFVVLRQTLS